MIRSSLIALVIALSLGFAPQKAEAAGDIQLECWTGLPPGAGPTHTVGCTLSWFPVPFAQGAGKVIWYRTFECVSPNCQVFGDPEPIFYSVVDPAAATRHSYIVANCTGTQQIATVFSKAVSYKERRQNIVEIVERLEDEEGGIVTITTGPPLCPFVGGGAVGIG